jgi:hypothetical protein
VRSCPALTLPKSVCDHSVNLTRHSLPCCCRCISLSSLTLYPSLSTEQTPDIPPCARTSTNYFPSLHSPILSFGNNISRGGGGRLYLTSPTVLLSFTIADPFLLRNIGKPAPLVVFQPSRLPIPFASCTTFTITQHPSSSCSLSTL